MGSAGDILPLEDTADSEGTEDKTAKSGHQWVAAAVLAVREADLDVDGGGRGDICLLPQGMIKSFNSMNLVSAIVQIRFRVPEQWILVH